MRLILVIGIWLLSLGLVQGYLRFVESSPRREAPTRDLLAADGFSMEVELTFVATPDDFTEEPALTVSINGKPVIRSMETISGARPLRIDKVEHLIVGQNEFVLKANGNEESQLRPRAVRIRILRGPRRVAEHTLWAGPGAELAGNFVIHITKEGTAHTH